MITSFVVLSNKVRYKELCFLCLRQEKIKEQDAGVRGRRALSSFWSPDSRPAARVHQ